METSEIRQSLHYCTYIEHSKSMKLAADENTKLFIVSQKSMFSEEQRILQLGLFRSSMLLYALSVELILKARGLFIEIDSIISGKIKTYSDFSQRWKKRSGHEFNGLIEYYKIELTSSETKIINNLQPYSIWAGRFPYPMNEDDVVKFEKGNGDSGFLSEGFIIKMEEFFESQISNMR